jgi:oligopeptidase B
MKTMLKIFLFSLLIGLMFAGCIKRNSMKSDLEPPKAEKKEKVLKEHDHQRIDQYYWLRNREDPDVIAYLKAENAYTDNVLFDVKDLQDKLYEEIVGRIKQKDESVPYLKNGYWYYSRYEEGKEYRIHYRCKDAPHAKEEVLIDENKAAEPFDYYNLASIDISPDNRWMAYGIDTVSRRKYVVYFKDLKTGEVLKETLKNTTGQVAWANDSRTLYYTTKDEQTLRPSEVRKHILKTSVQNDVIVYSEDDETFNVYAYKSKSDDLIMIASHSTLSSEYQYTHANNPGEFIKVLPREPKHEYNVWHYDDHFYILSNWNAQNFRLMKAPMGISVKEKWQEIIPHRKDVLLEEIEVFKDFLVISERKEGILNLRVINWQSGEEYYIDFEEEVYIATPYQNPEFNTSTLRFIYTSMTTPISVYDYDMTAQERKMKKQQEVMGDFDADNYETRRLYAQARDGEQIPISIVHRKDLKKNGKNPFLLYGYGSYGHTLDPYFSSTRLSLLDRGFVFAIAHVRGGQIYGRQWYEEGKLLEKMNTFTDFIDCAEYVINENYTSPGYLFANGGSAGGLLMGTVVNMRPELFKGVVAEVPFVDVVTTMLDESIPLTTGEYDEWGNPNDSAYYHYMLSYSPYDNVMEQEYPHMLVTTGLHDSQVQYWEPAKWVAKLREMKKDDNLLLLRTDMETGHGGASGRFKRHRENAMVYAFMLKVLRMNN